MSPFSIFLFIPHQKLLGWSKPVDLFQHPPLPPCLTSLKGPGSRQARCRLAYKSNISGHRSFGGWFPLGDQDILERIIDRQTAVFAPHLEYWIEYQR